MDKWDKRFYRVALEVATWSKDPGEGVGAVLVSPDGRSVSWGFNGFPRNIEDTPERLTDDDYRRRTTVHAELNALLNCAVDPRGWTMYCTKFPCVSRACAQSIIQRGITRVVCPAIDDHSSWARDQIDAKNLLIEARIMLDTFNPGDEL